MTLSVLEIVKMINTSTESMKPHQFGYVYHIENPVFPGNTEQGYIGVVHKDKGIYKRFREHSRDAKHMRATIRKHKVVFESHVKCLFEGSLDDCYKLEAKLRPSQKMGWNIASGGNGANYKSEIGDLQKFRSELQSKRMQDESLKLKQAESFRKNYYSNSDSQKIRKQAALDHMANPEKRKACLDAMHSKKKCPYCEYENNAGNVTLHIKRKHSND